MVEVLVGDFHVDISQKGEIIPLTADESKMERSSHAQSPMMQRTLQGEDEYPALSAAYLYARQQQDNRLFDYLCDQLPPKRRKEICRGVKKNFEKLYWGKSRKKIISSFRTQYFHGFRLPYHPESREITSYVSSSPRQSPKLS